MAYFLRGAFAMGLNDAPSGERIHIGFFGRRNAGKSSVVNSNKSGSCSGIRYERHYHRPCYKSNGAFALGPVVIIDTPALTTRASLESFV